MKVVALVAGVVALGACTLVNLPGRALSPAATVKLLRLPDGGIQPQAVADSGGTAHIVFYRGDPGAGDLVYTTLAPESDSFGARVRVNSRPGSAVATGTIRGGQLAMGRNGRVHVVWNGSSAAAPKPPDGGSPLLYARTTGSAGATPAFEPQRNLMTRTSLLDGGGTIAADSVGRVYALWHAAESASGGEESRRLWLARSEDDGRTFAPESPVSPSGTGACPCCSVRAFADSTGSLYALFRGASERVNRDMYLLVSSRSGGSFRGSAIHPWKVPT